ncbi:MAG: class I SAM-dependent methyltransferase [Eubacteriales bacterium]
MTNRCRLCGEEEITLFHKSCRDNEKVDILKCNTCGMLQTSDMSVITDEWYENGEMHKEHYSSEDDEIQTQTWELWLRESEEDSIRRVNALKEYARGKKVLDFGCGAAGFLRLLKDEIDDMSCGIELDNFARKKLAEEGIRAYANIDEIEEQYDMITSFHVLEHLNEPKFYLDKIYEKLKGGGYLILETPNADDALISYHQNDAFKKFTFWSAHVMLYNSSNLETLVNQCGFETVDNGQVQRYPLSNHLQWLATGKPGGHTKMVLFNDKELNEKYEQVLKSEKICDTLFAIFRKPL